jgi:hypothetical protein
MRHFPAQRPMRVGGVDQYLAQQKRRDHPIDYAMRSRAIWFVFGFATAAFIALGIDLLKPIAL